MSRPATGVPVDADLQLVDKMVALGLGVWAFCITLCYACAAQKGLFYACHASPQSSVLSCR